MCRSVSVLPEPGYYEDGKFGIRIESLCLIVKTSTKFNFNNKGFLTFEPITLVPIQAKLIDASLLSESEVSFCLAAFDIVRSQPSSSVFQLQWLNDYHQTTQDVVGAALLDQGKKEVYNWLLKNTQPLG